MENTNLKQNGFFLIKIRKTINLYLWAETEDGLFKYDNRKNYPESKGYRVVPFFTDGSKEYLQINGKLVRIK